MLSREPHFVVSTLFCPIADDIYIYNYILYIYIYVVYYSFIYLSNQEGLLILLLCFFSRICFSLKAVIVIYRHDSVTNLCCSFQVQLSV